MISRPEAVIIAEEYLSEMSGGPDNIELVLVHEETLERSFGWFFFTIQRTTFNRVTSAMH